MLFDKYGDTVEAVQT